MKWLNWLNATPKRRKIWLPSLLGLGLTLAFFSANIVKPAAIEQLGNLLFDSYQRAKPRIYNPGTPVRIIDIDNESLKRLGQWPWPRTTLARLQNRLTQAGAGVIAYDIIFAEKDRTSPENILKVLSQNPAAKSDFSAVKTLQSHDRIFARALQRNQTVLGFFLTREKNSIRPKLSGKFAWGGSSPKQRIEAYNGAIAPLDIFEKSATGEGFVSFNPSGDGIIREAPLIARIGDDYYRSLSLEALRIALRQGAVKVRLSNGTGELASPQAENPEVAKLKVADMTIPTTPNAKFRVYYTKPVKDRYIPAWKILSDEIPMSSWADKVAGHIVFVGTGADGLKDLVATSIMPRAPGVLVHAQIVEQIIDGQFLKRGYKMSRWEKFFLLLSGILLSLALPRLNAWQGAVLALGLSGVVFYGSWRAFAVHQTLFSPIYILLALLTIYLLTRFASFYLAETERARIRSAFSMYLSPTMVKKVSEDPSLLKLGGVERQLTIMFLDIRSFSKISENMQPEEITTFLNIFLSPMTDILQNNQATIDKYIGDAIVAFWNAPLDDENHAENAGKAVLQMRDKLAKLNAKYQDSVEVNWPKEVAVGIGLNTGLCCVGNLGSNQRFSYSMIGDAANLASRIEGLTKQYKVPLLVGHATAKQLTDYALLEADKIRVVGRHTPERIYILLDGPAQAKRADYKEIEALHKAFLKAYRKRDWKEAEKLARHLEKKGKELGLSAYYRMMECRIEAYRETPPDEGWGGVYEATQK